MSNNQHPQFRGYDRQAFRAVPVTHQSPVQGSDPLPPQQTMEFYKVSGTWLMILMLSFIPPALMSIFPEVGLPALLALVVPALALRTGYQNSKDVRPAWKVQRYDYGFLLAVPLTLGCLWQFLSVYLDNSAGISVYLTYPALLAMFVVSIVSLNSVSRVAPAMIDRKIRILANALVVFAAGTSFGAAIAPLLLVLPFLLIFTGMAAFWIVSAIPIIGFFLTLAFGIKENIRLNKQTEADPHRPRSIFSGKLIVLYSLATGFMTFVLAAFIFAQMFMEKVQAG